MQVSTSHENSKFEAMVASQFEQIYEQTSLVVVGSLGRTALTGSNPSYWHRTDGELRDIDVYDPLKQTPQYALQQVDNNPLPLDTVGTRWLSVAHDGATLTLPRSTSISITVPADFFHTQTKYLLGAPVRVFRPEVMLGLNACVPYDRIRQRQQISDFTSWVLSQESFNVDYLQPFLDMRAMIMSELPFYRSYLQIKDLVSFLPKPIRTAIKSSYNVFR